MRHMRDRFGARHLNFYDDQFTLDRHRVLELAKRLADEPLGLTFNCAARPDRIDPDVLTALKRAGCWMISLGIETETPVVGAPPARRRPGAAATAFRLIKRAGLRAKGLVMLGCPARPRPPSGEAYGL
jgi:histone acetyltransferase (RNA polymerase elongator complex component)